MVHGPAADFDPRPYIAETRRRLRVRQDVAAPLSGLTDRVRREIDGVLAEIARGGTAIPELPCEAIAGGTVTDAQRNAIRRTGCVIIRGVFPRAQAEAWNRELGDHIEANHYYRKARAKAGLDKYFSDLKDAVPQIFGLYWSKPQVMARQAESMAGTKRFLNRLWDVSGPMGDEFDPDFD